MIDFGTVDAADAEAIGEPGRRTFRLRARAQSMRAALWMEKEQLGALGRAISRLLAERAPRPGAGEPQAPEMGDFDDHPDVDVQVARLGLDYDVDEDVVVLLADDREALEQGNTPGLRMLLPREIARALVREIASIVASGRPLCPLCGRPLEGSGEHFCPGSNGHSEDLEIPEAESEEDE